MAIEITTIDSDSDYPIWKSGRHLNNAQLAQFREVFKKSGVTTRFLCLILFDINPDFSALAQTINSLGNQHYNAVSYLIISKLPPPDGYTAEQLNWIQSNQPPSSAFQEYSSASPNFDWFCICAPGDTLAEHALLLYASHIALVPDKRAWYADNDYQADCTEPDFKPDLAMDYLLSHDYVHRAVMFNRESTRILTSLWEGEISAASYDLLLQLIGHYGSGSIGHIADVLHTLAESPAANLLPFADHGAAVQRHLARSGVTAEVLPGNVAGTLRVAYPLGSHPRISIIIPTRDQMHYVQRCVESLFEITTYQNYEILIVNNQSRLPDSIAYLDGLRQLQIPNIRVIDYDQPFNFSAMNNVAADISTGEFLLFLNNDTAILQPDWLDIMMSHALRSNVGAVGARLIYADKTIQHAGVILGMSGLADHPFNGVPMTENGPGFRLQTDQNLSCVTAACFLLKKGLFNAIGRFDDSYLAVLFNDVDLSLKIRQKGLDIVWTPHATLLHDGSISLKSDKVEPINPEAKLARSRREQMVMWQRWKSELCNDPFFNPNLSLQDKTFKRDPNSVMCWDALRELPLRRILAQPADLHGCGYYRILSPLYALNMAGYSHGSASTQSYFPVEINRAKIDTLVSQRQILPQQINNLAFYREQTDAFMVYELDDLITDIPANNPHSATFKNIDVKGQMAKALSHCHRLVVSTSPLAEAYGALIDDVVVAPNYLAKENWLHLQTHRQAGERPRVGWAGGVGHRADLNLIKEVVRTLSKEVEWVFLGNCPSSLRPFVHEFHPPVSVEDYPVKLASLNLDLAIAPLAVNPFNEAKSNLKLLEYGVLGYPVICTDIFPYQDDFPVTRVKNRHQDWINAIREHINELDECAKQGDALRDHVRKNWMLEDHLDAWLKAWLP